MVMGNLSTLYNQLTPNKPEAFYDIATNTILLDDDPSHTEHSIDEFDIDAQSQIATHKTTGKQYNLYYGD